MWVLLRNHFYAPSGVLYRKSATRKGPPVEIPAEYRDRLPSSAQVVAEDYVTPAPQRVSADTLSEHRKMLDEGDPAKQAAASQMAAASQAEQDLLKQQEENRIKFQEELAAEKRATREKLDAAKLKKKGKG